MKLKIGTIIYPSELGHNGFLYPDKTRPMTLTGSVVVTDLPWVGDNECKAVKSDVVVAAYDEDDEYHHIKGSFWISKN